MAYSTFIEHLEIRNGDITLCFTCANYGKRIEECIRNLMVDSERPETLIRKEAFYGLSSKGVVFRKGATFEDDNSNWVPEAGTAGWDAFFFENTDYPLHVRPDTPEIKLLRLTVGKENSQHVTSEDSLIFGSINFKNQVGRTDIKVLYEKAGTEQCLSFTTEVLSYKMDYRTDMSNVIRDIEEEFAMLSYSYLKETYQTFNTSNSKSTDLIWWQIFRDCFQQFTDATRRIICNPKRRLQTTIRYERVERMPYIPAELENEYNEFKKEPGHLYRMEEMYLSKDTVENRFLKYALNNTYDRFKRVLGNVVNILQADNLDMINQINGMNQELSALVGDPFFRGIGAFKGLNQESLVMKQAAGYRDVYEQWIKLQCGYDLQEGIMQLEVKDISELYEIWCFIKVKDMVKHILRDKALIKTESSQTEGNFIKSLIQGSKSEVTFWENERPDVQLASIMYNATTDDEEHLRDESDISDNTDIIETTSKTTEQRPDIVLRLSKKYEGIQYTYLFDAKYRIRDTTIPQKGGVEVPPVGAINQMHRYRDAIYFTNSSDEQLKREVIGGYVLYPGNLNKEQFVNSYYQRSVDEVNIGAFPLKPGGHWHKMYKEDGVFDDLLLDPTSSEDVLYHQIETWLNDDHSQLTLLKRTIPQKGLHYQSDTNGIGVALIMLENYDTKSKTFKNGKIAIPIKFSKGGKMLLEHSADIRYVLFHTRNKDNNKHLFQINGNVRILLKEDAIKEDYYLIQKKDIDLFICVEIDLNDELNSLHLNPCEDIISYGEKKNRYDSQYSTLEVLKTNNNNTIQSFSDSL